MFSRASLIGLSLLIATTVPLRAQSCEEAYYQRNIIYKNAGYCFRTARAIQMFGNSGCAYDQIEDVPLSAQSRRAVSEIQAFERRNGCPR